MYNIRSIMIFNVIVPSAFKLKNTYWGILLDACHFLVYSHFQSLSVSCSSALAPTFPGIVGLIKHTLAHLYLLTSTPC